MKTEFRQYIKNMKKHSDILIALAKLGDLMTRTLDTSEILKQVVSITANIMKVDVCSIYLIDPSDGTLVLAATVGLNENAVGKARILPGEGITGRAAKQGRILTVMDIASDKRNKYIPITGEELFHSILSVPLEFQGETIGVINVQTKTARVFQKNERQILKTIVHQVSGLIRNAMLYEKVLFTNIQLEKAQKLLIESEKMAALGKLSATVAHELRNPLAGLKGASQLLLKKTNSQDERFQYVNLIIDEVDRLGKIVDDLILFAKPRALRYEVLNANEIIEDMLLLHSGEISQKKITIRKRLSKIPSVTADKDKLKQVFVNIILNAIESMPDGGELFVSSGVTMNITNTEVTSFQFRDTGQGIPETVLEHVFEPFYTTKPDGVGLGLAICKSIIDQHNGSITVQSGQNGNYGGTLITIEIPSNSALKTMETLFNKHP